MSLNFSHIQGDTFEAVNFQIVLNEVALDLTGAVIKMQLKKQCNGVAVLALTSVANAGLTITSAPNGLFKINKQIINIPRFNYLYDIQITFANGDIKTWVDGIFTIECDITR